MSVSQHGAGTFRNPVSVGLQNNDPMVTEARSRDRIALGGQLLQPTNDEMRAALAERGHRFGYGTLQRLFRRHSITRKKKTGHAAFTGKRAVREVSRGAVHEFARTARKAADVSH